MSEQQTGNTQNENTHEIEQEDPPRWYCNEQDTFIVHFETDGTCPWCGGDLPDVE